MRSFLNICLVLAGVVVSGFSQEPAKIVFWSDKPECGRKNELVAPEDKFACNRTKVNGEDRMTLEHGGLVLSARELKDYKYFLLKIEIKNGRKEAISLFRPSWMVAQYSDESAFLSAKKPLIFDKSLPPPAEPVSTFSRSSSASPPPHSPNWSNQTRAASEPGSKGALGDGGTRSSRSTSSYVARGRALYNSRLAPGDEVEGLIYFQLEKTSQFKLLFAEIGNTKYVFQFRNSK